jgi:hypothetical protein
MNQISRCLYCSPATWLSMQCYRTIGSPWTDSSTSASLNSFLSSNYGGICESI